MAGPTQHRRTHGGGAIRVTVGVLEWWQVERDSDLGRQRRSRRAVAANDDTPGARFGDERPACGPAGELKLDHVSDCQLGLLVGAEHLPEGIEEIAFGKDFAERNGPGLGADHRSLTRLEDDLRRVPPGRLVQHLWQGPHRRHHSRGAVGREPASVESSTGRSF